MVWHFTKYILEMVCLIGDMMRVIKNYLYNLTYQIFVLIVPLITIPYISRVLGATGVGINTLTNSVVQYFVLIATLGLATYGQREIAYTRGDKKKVTKTFWEIQLLSIVTTIISLLLFTIFLLSTKQYTMYYLCQSILILSCAADISWFFIGLELFKITVIQSFIVKLISVLSIFIFVHDSGDLYKYILIIGLSTFFGNAVLWTYLRKYIVKINWHELKVFRHFKATFGLFIPQISVNIYVYLNKIMLGGMVSVEAAGFFDSSDKIVRIGLTLISALTTVMMPRVASSFSNGNHSEVYDALKRSFQISMIIAFPLMFGIIAISGVFVPWFFGTKFIAVTPILVIESFAIVPIACSTLIGMQYLVPTKRTNIYTKATILAALINIFANLVLIHYFKASGTAIATVISEIFIAIYELRYISKAIQISSLFKEIYKIIIASICMFIAVKIMTLYIKVNIISILSEIIIGIFTYLIVLLLLKYSLLKEIKSILIKTKR